MEILSVVFSAFALLIAVYTYFAHDRKLKKQEFLLNEYGIKKAESEEREARSAVIRVSYNPRSHEFRIFNAGKAKAKNISVNTEPQIISSFPFFTESMQPQAHKSFPVPITNFSPDCVTVTYSWDDDVGPHTDSEELQLCN